RKGSLKGGGTLTLNGITNITGPSVYDFKYIEDNTTIINNGTMLQQGVATITFRHGTLINNASGVIDLQTGGGDLAKATGSQTTTLINEGLIKRTGTGNVTISTDFQNLGGTISVEGGALRLNGPAIT